ncbi:phytoene/squalene synthase family protein [Virgisporangium ochraceum]|uniref:Phytoene synthase n=1 Tax=Virgisporangium ochraceum TaxID=65505 RepID=A0A8J4A2M9_9ACTN|nr:phytoene/squalene synthase family protein [Virgisporangium ochraceum]GIJ71661.1 phytoene synthase [Virgisporangium ochraceum]
MTVWPPRTGAVDLDGSYRRCRAVNREHGRTYYLATHLLPRWKRRHVHALYGFTRRTDDIVDGAPDDPTRADRLRRWTDRFLAALDGAPVDDPVLPAVLHTIAVFDLDRADFVAFLRSMEADLTIDSYATYDDLLGYMDGSAAAVGTLMLPILGASDLDAAREPARQLGLAFQLTNFIRDVGEDLDLGRIYLPIADLAHFHVAPGTLRARALTPAVRDLVAFEVGRARRHYALAAEGIPLLAPTSQACIRTAFRLYGGILNEVVRAGYDVFSRRATVPTRRRVAGLATSLLTPPGRPVRSLPGEGSR